MNISQSYSADKAIWETPWPEHGLEYVDHCPVCGSKEREILHENMVDNVFFIAPGKWTLQRCNRCRSAYLDPRPTRETLSLAYDNYYTHRKVSEKSEYASLSRLCKFRRLMVNGYTNWRYSTQSLPASIHGIMAAYLLQSFKKKLDREYRHMPKLPEKGGTLLDVGCGNGSFLTLAATCGWKVVGVDPDPGAVAHAVKLGLLVYEGGIEYYEGKSELFDVITLNHVIEHVYKPDKVLQTCFELLKPGGQIWLETPNIDSTGHARFQKNWRGLETPRHLVVFNQNSLNKIISEAGFTEPYCLQQPNSVTEIFRKSDAMEKGLNPEVHIKIKKELFFPIFLAIFESEFIVKKKEFLTMTASKRRV